MPRKVRSSKKEKLTPERSAAKVVFEACYIDMRPVFDATYIDINSLSQVPMAVDPREGDNGESAS